jgi:hypothetical protein
LLIAERERDGDVHAAVGVMAGGRNAAYRTRNDIDGFGTASLSMCGLLRARRNDEQE